MLEVEEEETKLPYECKLASSRRNGRKEGRKERRGEFE
jgi:hypothetical protein